MQVNSKNVVVCADSAFLKLRVESGLNETEYGLCLKRTKRVGHMSQLLWSVTCGACVMGEG